MTPQIATRPVADKRPSHAMRASDQLCLDLVSRMLYTTLLNPASESSGTVSPIVVRPTVARLGVRHASPRDKVTDPTRIAIISGHYRQRERPIAEPFGGKRSQRLTDRGWQKNSPSRNA